MYVPLHVSEATSYNRHYVNLAVLTHANTLTHKDLRGVCLQVVGGGQATLRPPGRVRHLCSHGRLRLHDHSIPLNR